jgi:hypothetical protein
MVMFFAEVFIQYFLKLRLFDGENLQNTTGGAIEVFPAGLQISVLVPIFTMPD